MCREVIVRRLVGVTSLREWYNTLCSSRDKAAHDSCKEKTNSVIKMRTRDTRNIGGTPQYLFLAMVPASMVFVAFAKKARHSMVAHLPASLEDTILLQEKRIRPATPSRPDPLLRVSSCRPSRLYAVRRTLGHVKRASRLLPCEDV